MTSLLVLTLWMGSGAGVAAALPDSEQRRSAWLPVAVILGPLWSLVALEQRPGGRE